MRAVRAIIGKDHIGWYVEDSWSLNRQHMGRKKCKALCGQINKAAALERERRRTARYGMKVARNQKRFHEYAKGRDTLGRVQLRKVPLHIGMPTLDTVPDSIRTQVLEAAAMWRKAV